MEPMMMVNFLQYGFWENEFEVWIYHPLWRLQPTWPWVFNDVPTKFQRCSNLIGRAPRMNTLGSSGKHDMVMPAMWLQNLRSYGLALLNGGQQGQPTGTTRIYLYSSWLKYGNDDLLQNLPSLYAPWGFDLWLVTEFPHSIGSHFTRTPATYSRVFHSRT